MGYDAEVLVDSPIVYTKAEDASGTTAVDSSGNAHPLTYTGGFTLGQPGPFFGSKSVRLDGIDGQILDATPSYLPTGGPFTLSGLFKLDPSDTSAAGLVGYGDYDTVGAFNEMQTTDLTNVLVDHGDGSMGPFTCSDLSVGFHHILYKEDGAGAAEFWVDGTMVGSATLSVGTFDLTFPYAIGNVASQFLNGWVTRVAVFGTDLSSGRIAAHYAAFLAELPPRLVHFFNDLALPNSAPNVGAAITYRYRTVDGTRPRDSLGRLVALTGPGTKTDDLGHYDLFLEAPADLTAIPSGSDGVVLEITEDGTVVSSPIDFVYQSTPKNVQDWESAPSRSGRTLMYAYLGLPNGDPDGGGSVFLAPGKVMTTSDTLQVFANGQSLDVGGDGLVFFWLPDEATIVEPTPFWIITVADKAYSFTVPVDATPPTPNPGHDFLSTVIATAVSAEAQPVTTDNVTIGDQTDSGNATAYASPFSLTKQIKHLFYAIRGLLGSESLLSGKSAVILSPSGTQTGAIEISSTLDAGSEIATPFGIAAAHIAGYYASKPVTAAINANAGTGASVSHIEGGDAEGRITVVTGSSAWAAGIQASVTFHTDYITATGVVVAIFPDDDATLAAWPTVRPRAVDGQVHKFDISFGVADTAAHTYKFKWHAHGE